MELNQQRPRENDPRIRALAAADVAARLVKECPEDFPADEAEELAKDIADAIRSHRDGYEVARELEEFHSWDRLDMEIAQILDGAFSALYEHAERAAKEWVQASGWQPALSIGSRATVSHYDRTARRSVPVEGEICKIDLETARYHVFCESLGHIREEDVAKGRTGTLSIIVNAEDVEPVESEKAA